MFTVEHNRLRCKCCVGGVCDELHNKRHWLRGRRKEKPVVVLAVLDEEAFTPQATVGHPRDARPAIPPATPPPPLVHAWTCIHAQAIMPT